MSTSSNLNIPVSLNLIVELIKKLPKREQKKIISLIQEQDEFVLSRSQIASLDKRSKTPLEKYIPAEHTLKLLKEKHAV
jgi:hypothetical protein